MKSMVFDTSSIISIATNNLLWVLKLLKDKFNGEFFITGSVKKELIDKPLRSKKYKLEAIMISDILQKKIIKYFRNIELENKVNHMLNLANNIFKAKGKYIQIVDKAEIESLSLALLLKSGAYVVDERTMRLLVEDPKKLVTILKNKLHTNVGINKINLKKFQKEARIDILRSVDLMIIAYETGLLDKYIEKNEVLEGNLKKNLLEGLLWGLRLRGCSISSEEINEVMKIEGFKSKYL